MEHDSHFWHGEFSKGYIIFRKRNTYIHTSHLSRPTSFKSTDLGPISVLHQTSSTSPCCCTLSLCKTLNSEGNVRAKANPQTIAISMRNKQIGRRKGFISTDTASWSARELGRNTCLGDVLSTGRWRGWHWEVQSSLLCHISPGSWK